MSTESYRVYVQESHKRGAQVGAVLHGDAMPIEPITIRSPTWEWDKYHYFLIDDGTPDTLPTYRPFQGEECESLVGCRLKSDAGTIRIVQHYDGRTDEFTLSCGRHTNRCFFTPKELLTLFSCDGEPCGVKLAD